MNIASERSDDGRPLMVAGALLFLFSLFVGLAIPRFALPRLALSAHLLGITQGTFLIAVGAIWPRLGCTRGQSLFGHVLAIYGCAAAWIANFCGAVIGAGGSMVPIASGGTKGTAAQETVIRILLASAAISLIAFAVLLLWRLTAATAATQLPDVDR